MAHASGTSIRRLAALTAASAVLFTAACTPHDNSTPTPWSPSTSTAGVTPSSTPDALVVPLPAPDPLDAYLLTPAEQVTASNAVGLLIDQCMTDFGFTPRLRFSTSTSPAPEYAMDARLGYTGRTPEQQAWQDAGDALAAQISAQEPASAAYLLVESGQDGWKLGDTRPSRPAGSYQGKAIPVGGCTGRANALLAGGDPFQSPLREMGEPGPLVKDLESRAWESAAADPRTLSLDQQWHDCMVSRGFDYANPIEAATGHQGAARAVGEPIISAWDPPGTPAELATAAADATCQLTLDYQDVAAGIRAEYERELIEQNQLDLDQIKAAEDQLLERAAEVLAGKALTS